jgi:hypothetical protein
LALYFGRKDYLCGPTNVPYVDSLDKGKDIRPLLIDVYGHECLCLTDQPTVSRINQPSGRINEGKPPFRAEKTTELGEGWFLARDTSIARSGVAPNDRSSSLRWRETGHFG